MRYLLVATLCVLFSLASTEQSFAQKADDLVGVWEPSHGKARVKIEKIGNKYYGKVVWLKEPIDPETKEKKRDKNNPDPALRKRRTLGLKILKDFKSNGKGYWDDGTIYDPENGTTYNCHITMKNKNTIKIRGYVGISAFGRTDVWKRLQ